MGPQNFISAGRMCCRKEGKRTSSFFARKIILKIRHDFLKCSISKAFLENVFYLSGKGWLEHSILRNGGFDKDWRGIEGLGGFLAVSVFYLYKYIFFLLGLYLGFWKERKIGEKVLGCQ